MSKKIKEFFYCVLFGAIFSLLFRVAEFGFGINMNPSTDDLTDKELIVFLLFIGFIAGISCAIAIFTVNFLVWTFNTIMNRSNRKSRF